MSYPYPLSLSGLAMAASNHVLFSSLLLSLFINFSISLLTILSVTGDWEKFAWLSSHESPVYQSLLFVKLVKGGRGDTDEKQAAGNAPFQFVQFFCNQLTHLCHPLF